MQWIEENTKDVEMLKRVDVSHLSAEAAEGSEQLVRKVQRHNKALSDLVQRFDKLAADREELDRTDHWLGRDSKTVLAERRRVVAESWDVLVTLRKLIQERKDLLGQLQAHVEGKIGDLEEQYNQAFEKAVKAISRENRSYLKAEPLRGPAWVEKQAENDDAAVALRERVAPLRNVLSGLGSAFHRAGQGSALTFRQREVYEHLN
jgi:hypothetical protein